MSYQRYFCDTLPCAGYAKVYAPENFLRLSVPRPDPDGQAAELAVAAREASMEALRASGCLSFRKTEDLVDGQGDLHNLALQLGRAMSEEDNWSANERRSLLDPAESLAFQREELRMGGFLELLQMMGWARQANANLVFPSPGQLVRLLPHRRALDALPSTTKAEIQAFLVRHVASASVELPKMHGQASRERRQAGSMIGARRKAYQIALARQDWKAAKTEQEKCLRYLDDLKDLESAKLPSTTQQWWLSPKLGALADFGSSYSRSLFKDFDGPSNFVLVTTEPPFDYRPDGRNLGPAGALNLLDDVRLVTQYVEDLVERTT